MRYFAILTFVVLFSMSCANVTSGYNHEGANVEVTNTQQAPTPHFQLSSTDGEAKEIPFFRDHETSSAPCYYWLPTGEVEVIEKGDVKKKNTDKTNNSDKKEE